ncbi:MAG TPA: hypothetical protein VMZ28_21655 [Kofleriaceae bacterium]|nr:hypothetical protein [Kofleriaceae bacterium]
MGLRTSVSCLGIVVLQACGPKGSSAPPLREATSVGEAFKSEGCTSIRPPTEPDLMGWDSGSRLNLKTLREQGVVGVRYVANGCDVQLEVLNCVARDVEYKFSPYAATETKVAKSQRDLFAELPVGASKLGGKVGGGRALRTDYMLAGMFSIPVMKEYPADKLEGDCARATHVVSKLYIGGFAMAAGEDDKLSAGASVFGAKSGLDQSSSAERVASEGNPKACAKAQEEGTQEVLCGVPLRLGLIPIEGRGGAKTDASAQAAPAKARPDDPVDAVQAAIPRMIELLRGGKTKQFFEEYMTADDLQEGIKGSSLDQLVQDFDRAAKDNVIILLRKVQTMQPRSVEAVVGGYQVTYNVDKNVAFLVDNGRVYVKN